MSRLSALAPPAPSTTPSSLRRALALSAATVASFASACALYTGWRAWRRRRALAAAAADDEHSMPLPTSYTPSFSYAQFDVLVLFPSTIEAQREKHYAVMSAEHLIGAEGVMLQPQDAQKKACTYGLDDSETEIMANLRLLEPRSIQFLHVSLESYSSLFTTWDALRKASTLVLNLCDGTELDGIPGLSVLKHLQAQGVAYTGADEAFFVVSTYKTRMKRLFDERAVKTAPWMMLEKDSLDEWTRWRQHEPPNENSKPQAQHSDSAVATADRPAHAATSRPSPFSAQFSPALQATVAALSSLPFPLLVKPDDSYCSCGITTRSVVFTAESALDYAAEISSQFTNIFVEQFVKGREFTVFLSGDARPCAQATPLPQDLSPLTLTDLQARCGDGVRVLAPVERAFDQSLPPYEQFISYEMFWILSSTTPGKDEFLFSPVPITDREAIRADGVLESIPLSQSLQEEALRAYIAVGGCGYARVDLRFDPATSKLAVLEVNANCGITQYRQTAMGEILRESDTGFFQVLDSFFNDARRAAALTSAASAL